jgi:predicted transcriptional regulator
MQYTIALPSTTLKKIEQVTSESAQSFVKKALSDRIAYEQWKRAELEAGVADIKAGHTLSNKDFWQSIESLKRGNKNT